MVNYYTGLDKENINMMKETLKIIDFNFAKKLSSEKTDLAFNAVGGPINMDSIILKKISNRKDIYNTGYDEKEDMSIE